LEVTKVTKVVVRRNIGARFFIELLDKWREAPP
jgi:hypothetical protein